MNIVSSWFRRHFSNPQVVILAVLLFLGFALIMFAGHMLAPAIASVIIAYLLDGAVEYMTRFRIPRMVSVTIVFVVFLASLLGTFFVLLPLLVQQVTQLIQQLPAMITLAQGALLTLPDRYPGIIEESQVRVIIATMRNDLIDFGQRVLSYSLASLLTLVTIVVYLILMPLLVFFFLKDKRRILDWFVSFLPPERALAQQVWAEVNRKIGSYVRGKVYEVLIVGAVTFIVFLALGLQFSVLLATLTGLSVLVPYIGAAVVGVPVALVALVQWGWGSEFIWVVAAYAIIQAIDGNLLSPLLFSEVVNLHPTAIIVAVLVFGGLWGFWGVFFAIPLATLVQAVLNAWPRKGVAEVPETDTAVS